MCVFERVIREYISKIGKGCALSKSHGGLRFWDISSKVWGDAIFSEEFACEIQNLVLESMEVRDILKS